MIENFLRTDERGVTPVIGIILVIAIVVILGAVVGTYSLGLLDNINEPPAQAVLDLQFEEEDNIESDAYDKFLWQLELTHSGGDSVNGEDITVYLDHGSQRITGTYNGTLKSGDTVELAVIHTLGNHDDYDCSDENTACSLAGDPDNYPDEDYIELTMIHEPSNSILLNEEINIWGEYGLYNDDEVGESEDTLTFA